MEKLNPYQGLLYRRISSLGIKVKELSYFSFIKERPDVIHLHWPERVTWVRRSLRFARPLLVPTRALLLLAGLLTMRARGSRVVWTVHNMSPHDAGAIGNGLWRLYLRLLSTQIDGVISMSELAARTLRAEHRYLANKPHTVIWHGHYREVLGAGLDKTQARLRLGLPAEGRIVTFVGQIKPYKNVDTLVRCFREIEGDDLRLLVTGLPRDDRLRASLVELSAGDPRIRLDLRFVGNDVLETCVRAADLVALPYAEVLNSGSALLALSLDRPVLVPAAGSLVELAEAVGRDWVRTYEGPFTAQHLMQALDSSGRVAGRAAPLEAFEWDTIGEQTIRFYRSVGARSRRGGNPQR
ncbi:glycosyltransferase [Arenibaculum pallidiluteum]|uniref:glycosyltransferase n=1 Tax=Arenibaculum pallidiluteum TaxID=2812559 RepID=UPI001A9688CD|nr:glycosyltransferase [Arenibaculum pallidiluteum]